MVGRDLAALKTLDGQELNTGLTGPSEALAIFVSSPGLSSSAN